MKDRRNRLTHARSFVWPIAWPIVWGLLIVGCKARSEEEKAPKPVVEVKTAKAEVTDLELTVRAPATIFPREQANIASRVTARIVKLNARKGAAVAAGEMFGGVGKKKPPAPPGKRESAVPGPETNLQKNAASHCPPEIKRTSRPAT